jgi:hypothetical protein
MKSPFSYGFSYDFSLGAPNPYVGYRNLQPLEGASQLELRGGLGCWGTQLIFMGNIPFKVNLYSLRTGKSSLL